MREVVKRALELSASAIILVHNHPSGDPTPSRADIDMTARSWRPPSRSGIAMHDHIIVGRQGHASFKRPEADMIVDYLRRRDAADVMALTRALQRVL